MSSNALFLNIYKELKTGKIDIPTLPELSSKIKNEINKPSVSAASVAKIISVDPTLSGYLINISNSSLYAREVTCTSVQNAIMHLGYNNTLNITTSYTMRSLFKPKVRQLRPILKELWTKSAELAALSSVLAKNCRGFEPETALTAGLLQDIGVLPIVQKLAKISNFDDHKDDIDKIIDKYAAYVGVLILQKWNFPEEIVEVARSRKKWMRDNNQAPDLADIVLLARLHSYIGTPKMRKYPALFKTPAFKKLSMDEVGPERSLLILEQAGEEINDVKLLLRS